MAQQEPQAGGRDDGGGQDGDLVGADDDPGEQVEVVGRGGAETRSGGHALVGREVGPPDVGQADDPQGQVGQGDNEADGPDDPGVDRGRSQATEQDPFQHEAHERGKDQHADDPDHAIARCWPVWSWK